MTGVPDSGAHLPLFRREAIEARRPPQYGEIVLLPGVSSRWVALAALALVAALAALITQAHYTRRSTVTGQLHPSEGLIRVTANQPGIVVESRAQDGLEVRQGDVLFVLSGDRAGPDAMEFQRGIATQIEARRRSMEEELRRLGSAEALEAEQWRRRIASLRAEMTQVARQGQLLEERVRSAEETQGRYQALSRQGYVSRDELLAKETDVAEARGRYEGQRRDALALERELGAAQRELETLRARMATQRAELQRGVMQARQEFTEVEARRRIVVTAPAEGRLTLLQAEVGQSVEAARPLAQLVPRSAKLVARLYVPSRAVGFLQQGTTVLLRYDAFPYQKFGQHVGRVESVSTAAVAATDLQGFSLRPELVGEPVFAVSVALPQQTIGADGGMALQAGMRVEADLLHETRPLYEWILEPLYAARVRLRDR